MCRILNFKMLIRPFEKLLPFLTRQYSSILTTTSTVKPNQSAVSRGYKPLRHGSAHTTHSFRIFVAIFCGAHTLIHDDSQTGISHKSCFPSEACLRLGERYCAASRNKCHDTQQKRRGYAWYHQNHRRQRSGPPRNPRHVSHTGCCVDCCADGGCFPGLL